MQFKDEHRKAKWVDVILPLAVQQDYSYSVPVEFLDDVKVGVRVEVPLRNKHYAGVISRVKTDKPDTPTRPIISMIDEEPIVAEIHLKSWRWVAYYYACSVGEVMNVALPSALKLSSETKIILNPYSQKSSTPSIQKKKEYLLHEALESQEEITISALRKLLDQKNVYQFLRNQLNKKHIYVKEELTYKFKPKFDDFIQVEEEWLEKGDEAFDLVKRSDKQTNTLAKIIELREQYVWIPKSILYKQLPTINNSVLKALEKKGLIRIVKLQVDRIQVKEEPVIVDQTLSDAQQQAADQIDNLFETKNIVLLQGVTGSGKTQIYIDKIRKVVEAGGQVLYLLPEIALTSQMLGRMQKAFSNSVLFFHSRMNSAEQVEVWQKVLEGHPIVLGARSSIFLPFRDLSLIIIDEEHDGSYKQQDPAPRYNARDLGVYLSVLYGSKILLGTATPSLESLQNKLDNKYGYVSLTERFGDATLPAIRIVDLNPDQESKKNKQDDTIFSEDLLTAIRNRVEAGEQVLLFQNRRGYAPSLRCFKCNWVMGCPNCDVSLTTHKFIDEMRCHYCGFRSGIAKTCPTCGNRDVKLIGFGTEKVENVLADHFPEYKIRRMDHDTMRGKNSFAEVISDMQMGKIDILIGTQMVTKGLDFDNITLVGILHADALFSFPDFRAGEKAFQLLTQVSGRAGRQKSKSEVIIQTFDPENWIIEKVLTYDFSSFSARELQERKAFKYPPFYRLITLTVKHKKRRLNMEAAQLLAHHFRHKLGKRILGPVEPQVARINNIYHMNIMIKMEKDPAVVSDIKVYIQQVIKEVRSKQGFSGIRVNIDVDPL